METVWGQQGENETSIWIQKKKIASLVVKL